MPSFKCIACRKASDSDSLDPSCAHCGSPVILEDSHVRGFSRESLEVLPPGVWRYQELLNVPEGLELVTLGEGGTPLLRARRLASELGLTDLLIKDETRNPTGSFIDRGSTVLVSLAKRAGVRNAMCSTTGNLGASLAAYCAKAGIGSRISIRPDVDRGKFYQMLAYGAEVEITGRSERTNPDRALMVTPGNPYILEGEKTTGFEVIDDLRWNCPQAVVVPVGTGGHLSMINRAFTQLSESGVTEGKGPRLLGVQIKDSEPSGSRSDKRRGFSPSFNELEGSDPIFREEALNAIRASHGQRLAASEKDVIAATSLLAKTEGIFAEPASASAVAGLRSAREQGLLERDETVVCVITGSGLKDTRAIAKIARAAHHIVSRDDFSTSGTQIGATKLTLLRLLRVGPSFGYDLWKKLSEQRTMTTASVYQHLAELETFHLVRRSGVATARGRERVFYDLTPKGEEFLRVTGRIQKARMAGPPQRK